LEIIVGERPLEGSSFQIGGEVAAETLLTWTPVIGEGVLIYEAIAGRTVAGNRKLSNSERVAAGFGAVLPYIVAYSVKVVATAVGRVLTITRRAVLAALEYNRVYSILETAQRLARAAEIGIGLRVLTESEFQEFRTLLRAIVARSSLNTRQLARLNYFFLRMQDTARLAQWLRIIDQELGSNFAGLQRLKGVKLRLPEEQALTLLAGKSAKSVVALPEVVPIDYPGRSQIPGASHPDGVWDGELFDLMVSKGASIGSAVGEIGKKQAQASTVVVALLENAKFASSDIEAALPRVWGSPYAAGVSRVVILDAAGVAVHMRPDGLTAPAMAGLLRLGLGDPKRLSDIAKQLQTESP
jgi:hypothetical protein